jgi:nicotinamidase-related amidase
MSDETKSPDLHGNAPDNASVALLLIDVINDLEFEGGEELKRHALPAARKIAELKRRAIFGGIPTVYINDNFGKWRSDFKKLVAHCLENETRGREIVQLLSPATKDYFVLKPKQSGFFSTTLETLLKHLGTETLIVAGWTGDICVLFTAADAHMRDYRLFIPSDCVVSQDAAENDRVLAFMERVLEADIRPSTEIDLKAMQSGPPAIAGGHS